MLINQPGSPGLSPQWARAVSLSFRVEECSKTESQGQSGSLDIFATLQYAYTCR